MNNDNVVNTLDYVILRDAWMGNASASAADIDGDGTVNETDYNVLTHGWYNQGDDY